MRALSLVKIALTLIHVLLVLQAIYLLGAVLVSQAPLVLLATIWLPTIFAVIVFVLQATITSSIPLAVIFLVVEKRLWVRI